MFKQFRKNDMALSLSEKCMMETSNLDTGSQQQSVHSIAACSPVVRSDPRPRLALIGNAPLTRDHSVQIDSSDVVIRCNEAKTLGGFSGTRTDILCITNTGSPARRIIAERSVRPEKFPQLTEVWFPRDSGTHLSYLAILGVDYPESEFYDQSDRILEVNNLASLRVVRFSAESNRRAFERLKRVSKSSFICPSTGFLALCTILEDPRYTFHDKYLFGFTFRYWDGHPVEAEKREIRRLCSKRVDLRFIPVSKGLPSLLFHLFWRK